MPLDPSLPSHAPMCCVSGDVPAESCSFGRDQLACCLASCESRMQRYPRCGFGYVAAHSERFPTVESVLPLRVRAGLRVTPAARGAFRFIDRCFPLLGVRVARCRRSPPVLTWRRCAFWTRMRQRVQCHPARSTFRGARGFAVRCHSSWAARRTSPCGPRLGRVLADGGHFPVPPPWCFLRAKPLNGLRAVRTHGELSGVDPGPSRVRWPAVTRARCVRCTPLRYVCSVCMTPCVCPRPLPVCRGHSSVVGISGATGRPEGACVRLARCRVACCASGWGACVRRA